MRISDWSSDVCSSDLSLRGTFAGLSSSAVVEHLRTLGVTADALLPIHALIDARNLVEKGLRNYWGYNRIAYFAPEPRNLHPPHLGEFQTFVQVLHEHGLEGVLQVVLHQTAKSQ